MSKLKYRFTAQYKDGSIYQQNEEDISIGDSSKSCFHDVKIDELILFNLANEHGFFSVDLMTGLFKANNAAWFSLYEGASNFKLIYFRRVTKEFIDNQEVDEKIHYHLGWVGTDSTGNEIKRTIVIE